MPSTPVSLLLASVTLGLFGFVGVRLFEPDLIGGLVSGTPLWMKVSGIVALLPVLHIAVAPVILGRGERLWDDLEGIEQRFQIETVSSPSGVTHMTFTRRP